MSRIGPSCAALAFGLLACQAARAQTDEIQVYDASIENPGEASLTLHNNYTPDGRDQPAFPHGIIPYHTENGTFEWALGIRPWWELGLYLPLYSFTDDGKILYNGVKLRSEFVSPHAKNRRFFYGVNFEFSVNTKHWDTSHYSGEIRPIAGLHLGRWDVIVNPIFDTEFDGIKRLDFAPEARVMYNFTEVWALGGEQYSDFGKLNALAPPGRGDNTCFAVADYTGKPVDVEFGVGYGYSGKSNDRVVLKLILAHEF
jgi:hypothetical protein